MWSGRLMVHAGGAVKAEPSDSCFVIYFFWLCSSCLLGYTMPHLMFSPQVALFLLLILHVSKYLPVSWMSLYSAVRTGIFATCVAQLVVSLLSFSCTFSLGLVFCWPVYILSFMLRFPRLAHTYVSVRVMVYGWPRFDHVSGWLSTLCYFRITSGARTPVSCSRSLLNIFYHEP